MPTSVTAATVSAAVHTGTSAAGIYSATDTAVSRAARAALILLPIPILVFILIFVGAVFAHLQFVGGDIVFQCDEKQLVNLLIWSSGCLDIDCPIEQSNDQITR